jgi:hypothetical protein
MFRSQDPGGGISLLAKRQTCDKKSFLIGNSRRWKRWPNISESGRDLRLNAISKNEINK